MRALRIRFQSGHNIKESKHILFLSILVDYVIGVYVAVRPMSLIYICLV